MASSSIPTLKKNLKAQLVARAGLAGVQVSYGYPGPVPEIEYVWLADAKGGQDPATIGTRARDERYVLTVLIKTETAGVADADQQTATERAFALMAELEAQLRTDPTVAGALLVAQIGGQISLTELAGEQSRGALLEVGVSCRARI